MAMKGEEVKKRYIFFFLALLLLPYCTSTSDKKSDIHKVYEHISKRGRYATADGKVIHVLSRKYTCSRNFCQLILNGKKVKINEVHYLKDNQIVNALSAEVVGSISDEQRIAFGLNPAKVRGKEPKALKGITAAHNHYRRKTGVPPLQWSDKIAAYSQKWANYLRNKNGCRMKHRAGRFKIKNYGENLAFASNRQMNSYYAVKLWYDEIKYYNYKKNSCSKVCGHYTQLVWKTSKLVGCAIAYCKNSEVWVCNYDPPGNYVGKRPY